jgi:hypothetical protein
MPAQQHHGDNIGDTPTHCILVDFKEAATSLRVQDEPGPVDHLTARYPSQPAGMPSLLPD